jgi:hypothetical protein
VRKIKNLIIIRKWRDNILPLSVFLSIFVVYQYKSTMKKHLLLLTIALISLGFSAQAQIPSYVPTTGLVGWYPFTGNANDVVGSNNGTSMGATLTTDRFGNADCAYSFNGTSDYIWVPGAPFTAPPYTISAWVYVEDLSKSIIVGLGETGTSVVGRLYFAASYSNTGSPAIGSDGSYHGLVDTSIININTWVNITVVSEPSNWFAPDFYINGVKYVSEFVGDGGAIYPEINNTGFDIGKHTGTGSSKYMKGKIDDLGFWNRVLTTAEISSLYTMVGVEEISNSLKVSVYPNPAADFITISLNQSLSDQEYKIFDPSGKVLKSGVLQSNENQIDISNFSNGLYLLFVNGHPAQRFSVLRD